MTRQLTILTVYIFVLFGAIIFNHPFYNYIVVALTLLLFGYQVFLFLQLAKNSPNEEVVFRQRFKSIRLLFILLALIPTVGYFINGRFNLLQITVFWTIVLFDIVISILTKKLKPVAFAITGTKLKLNNQIKTSRDLSALQTLVLNGFTNEIKLTFSDQKDLLIKRNEFSDEDIQKMIETFIQKSKEGLIISDNLKNNCR